MRTNERMRRRFESRVAPDTTIEAVVALTGPKGPNTGKHKSVLQRYLQRYGLTNTLGSHDLLGAQWLVLTEHRLLFFAKKGSGPFMRVGRQEHALERTDVELQWADFTEATLRKRLLHLTTSDHRMNISQTLVTDEAELLVRAVGDRGRQIGLQEL